MNLEIDILNDNVSIVYHGGEVLACCISNILYTKILNEKLEKDIVEFTNAKSFNIKNVIQISELPIILNPLISFFL